MTNKSSYIIISSTSAITTRSNKIVTLILQRYLSRGSADDILLQARTHWRASPRAAMPTAGVAMSNSLRLLNLQAHPALCLQLCVRREMSEMKLRSVTRRPPTKRMRTSVTTVRKLTSLTSARRRSNFACSRPIAACASSHCASVCLCTLRSCGSCDTLADYR